MVNGGQNRNSWMSQLTSPFVGLRSFGTLLAASQSTRPPTTARVVNSDLA